MTNAMDMNLGKLWEMEMDRKGWQAMDRKGWQAAIHGVAKTG